MDKNGIEKKVFKQNGYTMFMIFNDVEFYSNGKSVYKEDGTFFDGVRDKKLEKAFYV